MALRNTLFRPCPPLAAFLLVTLLLAMAATAAQTEDAQFLSVIDGDSLVLEIGGRSREVRLIGIDAPEHGQEYGIQARCEAMRLCYGQPLRVEYDKRRKDRYGRLLAYVYTGDKLLNAEMVRAGLALAVRYEPNVRHEDALREAELEARARRRGFWTHGGLKQTPAEWRKRHPRR
ncbi:thermonuclease family protein [Pseudodesulfovibrio sp.]|uniref:thermonuclease family protein n=1 Tax=Pseudodesulfovibrio sp. TaxID=2035812 RepID=UPI00260908BE|nr:thermonuclease family protein [Pseudodesulfovibrio sp.]MDD3311332.1 thermonuclease family protein [Pseudodesulfovibrio sp.]